MITYDNLRTTIRHIVNRTSGSHRKKCADRRADRANFYDNSRIKFISVVNLYKYRSLGLHKLVILNELRRSLIIAAHYTLF